MGKPLLYNSSERGWSGANIEAFTGGLNSSRRAETIADNDLLTATNVVIRQGKIIGDTGYKTFGQVVLGTPQVDYQNFRRTGISELILITTATVYVFSEANRQWQFLAGDWYTTTSAPASAGATTINIVPIGSPALSVGDNIGIALTDGSQHQTTVAAPISSNFVVLAAAVPVGKSVAMGASIKRPVVLNGTLDRQVSLVPVASQDWLAFTNGIDQPMRYDGIDILPIPGLPSFVETCVSIAEFNAALFLMGPTEGGLSFPQRIRRSDIGDPTNWTTNLSGYDDLYNSADFIIASEKLGPYLIIYRERSIIRGQFVNTAGKIYSWDPAVEGEGVVSTQAVVNLDAEHLIFANAGIYSYSGGYDLKSVGDKIFYGLFSTNEGDLNSSFKHRVFAFYVEELDEAWFVYPAGASELPNTILRYSVGEESWYRRDLVDPVVGYGFYQTTQSLRWLDLIGPWTAQTWSWNSRLTSGDSPTTHLCGQSQVFEYDYITTTDNGTAIPVTVETKDFFSQDYSIRFDEMQAYLRGTNVTMSVSFDSGQSYVSLGTVSESQLNPVTTNYQAICNKMRFRFTTTSPGFILGWLSFVYRLETSYRI